MSTMHRYTLPVEETGWHFEAKNEIHFCWEYDDERDKLNEDGDVGDLGGECKLAREVDIWSDLFLARAARWSTGFSFRECHSFCGCWSSSSKKGFSTSA